MAKARMSGVFPEATPVTLETNPGYGHHSAADLISMIYLRCGGITVELPFS